MKRIIFVFLILLVFIVPCFAALTNSLDGKKTNAYWGTRKPKDGLMRWVDEVEALVNASAGTATASKAVVLNSSSQIDALKISSNLKILESTGATYYTMFSGGNQSADVNYVLPTADGSDGQQLTTDANGVLSWADAAGTFTGGSITGDITLSDDVDILPTTVDTDTWSIQVRDIDGAAYLDVLRWTNANTPTIVFGHTDASLALASTGLNVTAGGVITGAAGITNTGVFTTSGGAATVNASGTNAINIGTGSFSGTATLGNNGASVGIASSVWDITTAGAMSGFTSLSLSGDITIATGKGIKSSTTDAHTAGLYGYDVDGAVYVGGIVMTNSNTPATVVGNSNGTTAITSSDWAISTTGDMTGIGAVTTDGLITGSAGATISGDISCDDIVADADADIILSAVKTVVKTIDVNSADTTGSDFQLDNTAANMTEQPVDLGAIIPAYAEIVSAQLRCTETVTGSAQMAIDIGVTTGAGDILASANVDTANDIKAVTIAGSPVVAALNTAQHVWINATPDANWNTPLVEGRWAVMVTYIDYGAVYTQSP